MDVRRTQQDKPIRRTGWTTPPVAPIVCDPPADPTCVRHDRPAKERRWSASNGMSTRKWRSTNASFDVFDKLMVRADRGGKMGRQLSLESPQRPMLRRQTSDEVRPGPLKIAWTADQTDQPSVEVVAKKCGQPKPSTVKPPRSPYHQDESAAVLYSRQQLTERLRSSWKKNSGRHNLNIFLNQSVESETDSVSEVVDSPLTRSPSTSDGEDEAPATSPKAPQKNREESASSCASDRRAAFRMMGRQSKISESNCSTPEPGKNPVRRMMSAPSRPPSKKFTKSASVESNRVKSAPSKRKHKQPQQRRRAKGDSSDEDKTAGRRVKRGVDKGEIVTMVSLVSPAETEDEEPAAPTPDIKPPPTPKPPPESPRPNPPPPILTLRKPAKAVTFRPVVQPQPPSTQYQTSFSLKRTLVHQNTTGSVSGPSPTGRPPLLRQSTLPAGPSLHRPVAPRTPAGKSPAVSPERAAVFPGDAPTARPVQSVRLQRKPSIGQHPAAVRRKVIQATHSVIKLEPEPIKEADLPPAGASQDDHPPPDDFPEDVENSSNPVFKSSKEKECWDLFKKMSGRGVSVSFDTVLRGLLTPTEYRMRKAALLSVC